MYMRKSRILLNTIAVLLSKKSYYQSKYVLNILTNCLRYYEDLEDLITPIVFLQFLLTSLMICAVGLEGIMVINN